MMDGYDSAKIWDPGIDMCGLFLQWIHDELFHFGYTNVYIRVAQRLGEVTFIRLIWDPVNWFSACRCRLLEGKQSSGREDCNVPFSRWREMSKG